MLKLFLTGNLVADPKIGEVNGQRVTNVRIAAHTPFKDEKNEYITNFVSASVWGKQADTIAKLHKGDRVGMTGSFCVKIFMGKDGKQPMIDIRATSDTMESLTPIKKEEDFFDN